MYINTKDLKKSLLGERQKQKISQGRHNNFRLISASAVACLSALALGMSHVYTSPAIPDINDNPNPFHMTGSDQSWATSVIFLGGIPGTLAGAALADRWGRQTVLLLAAVPWTAAWITILVSTNAATFIAGRLILGFVTQPLVQVAIVYMAEVAPASTRGRVMSLFKGSYAVGGMMTHIFGIFLHWNYLALACMLPPLLLTVAMTSLPETPRWLLAQGRLADAAEVSAMLGGDVERVPDDAGSDGRPTPWLDFLRPPLLPRYSVSFGMSIFTGLSGSILASTYTVTLFQYAGSDVDTNVCSVLVGVSMIIGSLVASVVIGRFSQRHLLVISLLIVGIGWSAFAIFFLLRDADVVVHWLPLSALVVITFGGCLGGQTGALLIANELFATAARARACCLLKMAFDFSSFVINKIFIDTIFLTGLSGSFLIIAVIGFSGAVFIMLCVPETNCQNLDELELKSGK